jgi:histidine ammonia-lyase
MMSDPNRVVYGINTGFGNFADKIITHEQRSELQINLIRSHSVGVGEPIPFKTVKRMTILRINTLAKGRSGIDPKNLQKIIRSYNHNFIPMIP